VRAAALILAPLLALAVLASPALAVSANDNRTNAIPLGPDQISAVDTTGDTVESGEPNTASGGCAPATGGGGSLVGATEWYTVTGSGGPLSLTTDETTPTVPSQATDGDTVIFVYLHGSNTAIACNDEISATDLHSTVTFSSVAGQIYDVQVGQFAMPSSGFSPTGGPTVTAERPVNDTRAFPTTLTAGSTIAASNNAAVTDPSEPLICERPDGTAASYGRTVWFRFDPDAAGVATFTAGGSLDTVEAVYSGSSTTALACDEGSSASPPGPSSITLPVVGGGDYFVQVGTASGVRGNFDERVDYTASAAVTILSSGQPAAVGREVTYSAWVAPVPSGGTLTFTDAGAPIAGCVGLPIEPSTGRADCTVTYSALGSHSIVAIYRGEAASAGGAPSTPLTETVATVRTKTSLTVSPRHPRAGAHVALTARIRPVPLGGVITIAAGGRALHGCRARRPNARSGLVRCTVTWRRAGAVSLAARFSGSTGYMSSQSPGHKLVVAARRPRRHRA
jgi:hypothetical protein